MLKYAQSILIFFFVIVAISVIYYFNVLDRESKNSTPYIELELYAVGRSDLVPFRYTSDTSTVVSSYILGYGERDERIGIATDLSETQKELLKQWELYPPVQICNNFAIFFSDAYLSCNQIEFKKIKIPLINFRHTNQDFINSLLKDYKVDEIKNEQNTDKVFEGKNANLTTLSIIKKNENLSFSLSETEGGKIEEHFQHLRNIVPIQLPMALEEYQNGRILSGWRDIYTSPESITYTPPIEERSSLTFMKQCDENSFVTLGGPKELVDKYMKFVSC